MRCGALGRPGHLAAVPITLAINNFMLNCDSTSDADAAADNAAEQQQQQPENDATSDATSDSGQRRYHSTTRPTTYCHLCLLNRARAVPSRRRSAMRVHTYLQ